MTKITILIFLFSLNIFSSEDNCLKKILKLNQNTVIHHLFKELSVKFSNNISFKDAKIKAKNSLDKLELLLKEIGVNTIVTYIDDRYFLEIDLTKTDKIDNIIIHKLLTYINHPDLNHDNLSDLRYNKLLIDPLEREMYSKGVYTHSELIISSSTMAKAVTNQKWDLDFIQEINFSTNSTSSSFFKVLFYNNKAKLSYIKDNPTKIKLESIEQFSIYNYAKTLFDYISTLSTTSTNDNFSNLNVHEIHNFYENIFNRFIVERMDFIYTQKDSYINILLDIDDLAKSNKLLYKDFWDIIRIKDIDYVALSFNTNISNLSSEYYMATSSYTNDFFTLFRKAKKLEKENGISIFKYKTKSEIIEYIDPKYSQIYVRLFEELINAQQEMLVTISSLFKSKIYRNTDYLNREDIEGVIEEAMIDFPDSFGEPSPYPEGNKGLSPNQVLINLQKNLKKVIDKY